MKRRKKRANASLFSDHVEALKFINSFKKVSDWLSKYDIPSLLDQNNGFIRIPNFLPDHVAELFLKTLQHIPDHEWKSTEARQDYTHNNIEHSFLSTKTAPEELQLDSLLRIFTLLYSDTHHNTLSVARYGFSDSIAPHSDKAYADIHLIDTNEIVECSRDVTLVYYLTKDWKKEYGGALVDLSTSPPTPHIPEFNTAIFFKVPRMHQVEPVRVKDRLRYSVFGWYLLPGRLYELDGGNKEEEDDIGEDMGTEERKTTSNIHCKLAERILEGYRRPNVKKNKRQRTKEV